LLHRRLWILLTAAVNRGIVVAAAATVLQVAIAVYALPLLGQNLVVCHGYDRSCLRLSRSTNLSVTSRRINQQHVCANVSNYTRALQVLSNCLVKY
jgi:hypothetical protein